MCSLSDLEDGCVKVVEDIKQNQQIKFKAEMQLSNEDYLWSINNSQQLNDSDYLALKDKVTTLQNDEHFVINTIADNGIVSGSDQTFFYLTENKNLGR